MINMNPFMATDGYKTGHGPMYPYGTETVYSNFTPRSNRHAPNGVDYVVNFGQQMVVREIHELFEPFFKIKERQVIEQKIKRYTAQDARVTNLEAQMMNLRDSVCQPIKEEYSMFLNTDYDVSHIEELWDLGYLPIRIKALPEGTTSPIGVPVLTIVNTRPEQFWLTNFLETLISNLLWKPITSATIAHQYKKLLVEAATKTDENNLEFVEFQGHDFAMRGMDSLEAVISSGLGHATSFLGSDSLPVIHGARKYYDETEFVIGGVNATEHSVMSAGGSEIGEELNTFRYLMDQFPTGILSIVSDTWDLWKVITEYLPVLKPEIMDRDGKIVIRPDSGNPVDIICGELHYKPNEKHGFHQSGNVKNGKSYNGYRKRIISHYTPQFERRDIVNYEPGDDITEAQAKGVVELLWDIFGGTINEQGYKVLDPHIGAIYGDSITLDRAQDIVDRLEAKGFASTNVVLGIGSFTYQFNTRDTFGFAMKATYVEIRNKKMDGHNRLVGREIFKDPITDDGRKKSARGLLMVLDDGDKYILQDRVTWEMENSGELQTIYLDGKFENVTTLTEIRKRLAA